MSEKSAGSKHGPAFPKEYIPSITPVNVPPMGGDLVIISACTFDWNFCFVSRSWQYSEKPGSAHWMLRVTGPCGQMPKIDSYLKVSK